MGSIAENENKSPSAPHTIRGGIEGKICGGMRVQTRKNSTNCHEWHPMSDYPHNYAYVDGHSGTCKHCKKASRKDPVVTPPPPPEVRVDYALMTYEGVPVAFTQDTSEVCLTDVWRAAGSPGLTPAIWLRSDDAKGIVLAYQKANSMLPEHTIRSLVGRGDYGAGTWAPREIALAYAQKLNYDLWYACNRFVLNRSQQFVDTASHSLGNDALNIINRLLDSNNAILAQLGILPRIDQNTRQTATSILGARRIEIEVPAPVINGDVYFGTLNTPVMIVALQQHEADDWGLVPNLIHLLQTDWICLMFGESVEIAKRMKRHAGKNRIGKTTPVRPSITSDKPKDLENLFRDRKPSGVIAVPNTRDLLVVRKSVLPSLLTLPNHMPINEAKERLRIGWLWE